MKSLKIIAVFLATAVGTGYALNQILKKAGIQDIFDIDLNEEIDNEPKPN
jgi:hypothetical protein